MLTVETCFICFGELAPLKPRKLKDDNKTREIQRGSLQDGASASEENLLPKRPLFFFQLMLQYFLYFVYLLRYTFQTLTFYNLSLSCFHIFHIEHDFCNNTVQCTVHTVCIVAYRERCRRPTFFFHQTCLWFLDDMQGSRVEGVC